MNKKYNFWAVLAACSMAGCATEPAVPFTPKTPMLEGVDARLLVRCPKLPENVVITNVSDLLTQKGVEATMYNTCANRQDALATSIEKLKLTDTSPKTAAELDAKQAPAKP